MESGNVSSPSSPKGATPGTTLRPSAITWLRHVKLRTGTEQRWMESGDVSGPSSPKRAKRGGARRDRTADLLHAMQALSQLSYGPLELPRALGDARQNTEHRRILNTVQGRSQVSSSPPTSPIMSVTSSSPSSSSAMKVESSSSSSSMVSSTSMSSSDSGTTALTLPVFSSASASSSGTNSSASTGSGTASAAVAAAAALARAAASARVRGGATGAIGTTSPV